MRGPWPLPPVARCEHVTLTFGCERCIDVRDEATAKAWWADGANTCPPCEECGSRTWLVDRQGRTLYFDHGESLLCEHGGAEVELK